MDHSDVVSAQLEMFVALVEASPHNLVSRRARAEIRTRHIPECVALAALLPSRAKRVLDVGSGGGFPGIVLAIVRPELDMHLLDSTQKKTEFLQYVAQRLGMAITVHNGRAESLAVPPLAASFDVVTARAVAPLDRLVRLAVPFLLPGGVLYAVKGEKWEAEVAEAAASLRRVGARIAATPPEHGTTDPIAPRVVVVSREQ